MKEKKATLSVNNKRKREREGGSKRDFLLTTLISFFQHNTTQLNTIDK
jgi:hypothetical protein